MKIPGRKVLMSILANLVATVFLWNSKITPAEWVTIAVLTIVGYIAGEGFSRYVNVKNRKTQMGQIGGLVSVKAPTGWDLIKERIRSLFNAPFIAALVIYIIGTFLFWHGKIGSPEWMYITIGAIVGYDIINPIDKINK